MSKQDINLKTATDKQNVDLTIFPYLNFNEEAFKEIEEKGYIEFTEIGKFIDSSSYIKNKELNEFLNYEEFKNLKIIDIEQDEKTGFGALAFMDKNGNVGISYRASDVDTLEDIEKDWINTNLKEFFGGTSEQTKQAKEFFEKINKKTGKKINIYGYSLGGNLCYNVFAKNYESIEKAFVLNAPSLYSVRSKLLVATNNNLKAAFNDKDKFSCNIVQGDYISRVTKNVVKSENINYIKNSNLTEENTQNETENTTIYDTLLKGAHDTIESHYVSAIQYDSNGNFETIDKEEATKNDAKVLFIMQILKAILRKPYQLICNIKAILKGLKPLNLFRLNKSVLQDLPKENSTKEGQKTDFKEKYKLYNYIDTNYTKEQADKALEMASNPKMLIEKLMQNNMETDQKLPGDMSWHEHTH